MFATKHSGNGARALIALAVLVTLSAGFARVQASTTDRVKYTTRLSDALGGDKAASGHTIWVRFADKGLAGSALDAGSRFRQTWLIDSTSRKAAP